MLALTVVGFLACAGSTSAQTPRPSADYTPPAVTFRPFFLVTLQNFAASDAFTSAFGQASYPFYGGGVDLTFRHGIFVDLSASHFSENGQRAFVFNGQTYRLGIPFTATEIPVEASAGYRFAAWHRIRTYVGGGVGCYSYSETSESSAAGENVWMRHAGFLAVGGTEVRINSWSAIAVDVQWTYVPGILGSGGLSQGFENNLGGVAPHFRLMIGR